MADNEILLQIIRKQQELLNLYSQLGKIPTQNIDISNVDIADDEILPIENEPEKTIEDFMKMLLSKGLTENTVDTYRDTLKKYEENFGKEYTRENLLKWREWLNQFSARTINIRILSMMKWLEFTGNKGIVTFKTIKEQKRAFCDNVISAEQYEQLINWARENNKQAYVITKLLGMTGVRVSEAVKLKVDDLKNGYVDIVSKANKQRRIVFTKQLIEDIFDKCGKEFIIESKFGGPISTRGVASALQRYAEKSGIPKEVMHPHSFRHFFAKQFLKTNGDLTLLADLLGHSNIGTTAIYTRKSSKEQMEILNNSITW